MSKPAADTPQLRLLASAELLLPGQPPAVLAPKDAILLAHLALDGACSRGALAALLWQDKTPTAQRGNLRQRIMRLQAASASQLLTLTGDQLALHAAVEHDLNTIVVALQASPLAAQGALLGPLQVADSPAAATWLDQARQRVHAQRLKTLQAQADTLEHSNQLEAALAYTKRLVAEEPLLEHSHRAVMRLHYRRGEKAAALAAYRQLCKALSSELDTQPDAQTTELARLIEQAQPPAPHAAGASTGTDAAAASIPASTFAPAIWAALLRPPRLLQREAEWHQLSNTWTQGGIAIVLGEAGMGKTRLLNDFADSVALPLRLRAQSGDRAVPYALLSRWVSAQLPAAQTLPQWACSELARLAPELGPLPPGNLIPLRLVKALALLQPPASAVMVDDLQFADEASLELLPAVLQGLRCSLLGARGDEMPARLLAWTSQRSKPLSQVQLQPLNEGSVASLAALMLNQTEADSQRNPWPSARSPLLELSGGNPLFVLEWLRQALPRAAHDTNGSESPPGAHDLRGLFQRRLCSLTPAALRLVQVAALAPSDFSSSLAAAVCGLHELELVDAWRELQFKQLLTANGLTSDALAEAVASSVPTAIARSVQGRAAEFLAQSDAAPARVAQLWEKAGNPHAAWPLWDRAAMAAHRASRRAEELELLTRAECCAEAAGAVEAAFALALRAAYAAHAASSAHDTAQRIAALLRRPGPAELALDALLLQCKHLLDQGLPRAALAPCQRALQLAELQGQPQQKVKAAAWCGFALAECGRHDEANAVFAGALDALANCAQPAALADYHGAVGVALFSSGRYAQALPALIEAARLSEALNDLHEAMVQHSNVAVCHAQQGHRQQALHATQRALALWGRLGEPASHDAAATHMHAGSTFTAKGWYGQALQALTWALSVFEKSQEANWVSMTQFRLVRLYARMGRHDLARRFIQPPGAQAAAGTQLIHLAWQCKLDLQNHTRNTRRLETALEVVAPEVSRPDRLFAELVMASLQPAALALPRLQRVLAACEGSVEMLIRVHALARLADTLFQLDQPAAAGLAAQEALSAFELAPPIEMENLEFWWLVWRPLQRAGHVKQALAVLAAAQCWMDETLTHLPDSFRGSFLNQNPFVMQLCAAISA